MLGAAQISRCLVRQETTHKTGLHSRIRAIVGVVEYLVYLLSSIFSALYSVLFPQIF